MTNAEARTMLDKILAPLNARQDSQTGKMQLGAFIREVYYPFCRRKWKRSTRITTDDRVNRHLFPNWVVWKFGTLTVAPQDLLDRKAGSGLTFSLVGHLRCDLRHLFRVAVAEGIIERNPGELSFTPQNATRAVRRVAAAEEMARVFSALDPRERLLLKVAGISGMRPGGNTSSSTGESGTTVRRDPTAGVPRGY
jgi:hypothetical protein